VFFTVTSPPELVVTVPDDVPAEDPELADPELEVRRVVDVDDVRRGALDVVVRRTVVDGALRLLAGAVFVVAPASSAETLSRCVCWAARERSFWSAVLSAGLSPPPHAAAAIAAPAANARKLLISLIAHSSGSGPERAGTVPALEGVTDPRRPRA
jgi:hypothetical protein